MTGRRTPSRTPKKGRPQPDWPLVFLAHLARTGNVQASCDRAKIGRRTAYDRREGDPEFRSAWEDAERIAVEVLEEEARRRAVDGTLRPVFHQGAKCGAVREYSDTLLIFLLKARDPKYREAGRLQVAGDPNNPIRHDHSGTISVTGRIDALAAAFAGAADREEACDPPGDGPGERVDPGPHQGGTDGQAG